MARIGTTSMVFWRLGLAEGIEQAAKLGFDAIEIWVRHFERQRELTQRQLARLLKEAGLASTVHCPIRDINIASVNEGIRRESVRQMIEAIDFCAEIEGELLVVHPGKRSSKRENLEEQWQYQADSFGKILEAAHDRGVTVTVENMEWEKENELVRTPQDIKRLQMMLPEFNLPVTLDTTHMADTLRIIDAVKELGSDIIHVHLSDYGATRHIPLGEGNLDFKSIFQELFTTGFYGILSFEVFIPSDPVKKLECEKRKLEEILHSLTTEP